MQIAAKLLSFVAVACLVAQPAAVLAANTLTFRLTAEVPVICGITRVEPLPAPAREIVIHTNCNAERFEIIIAQPNAADLIEAATIASGRLTRTGATLRIDSERPGANAVRLVVLSGPVDLSPNRIMLRTL